VTEQELGFAIEDAEPERLEAFLDKYKTDVQASGALVPELKSNELRPYLPSSGFGAWENGGVQLGPDMINERVPVFETANEIKHRLLYCHSIALDDQFPLLASRTAADTRSGQKTANEGALQDYVGLLLHLAPLLREGIVCLIPPSVYDAEPLKWQEHGWSIHRSLYDNKAISGKLKKCDIEPLLSVAPAPVQKDWREMLAYGGGTEDFLRDTLFVSACLRTGSSLASFERLSGKVSVHLPFEYDMELFQATAQHLSSEHTGKARTDASHVLNRLVDLRLPGLDQLGMEEIVAVRSSSDAFENMRSQLASALVQADNLPPSVKQDDSARLRMVREILQPAKAQLEKELRNGRTLKQNSKGASVRFMVGGLTTMVMEGLSGVPLTIPLMTMLLGKELVKTTAATAASMVASAPGEVKRAAHAHYVALF
jgi:hypothetical protein